MKAAKLLLIVSLVLIGPTPAQGTSPVQESEAPHQVTLITGDVVTLYENNSFTVRAAERPDGRRVTFTGRTGDTIAGVRDYYVTPSDVEETTASIVSSSTCEVWCARATPAPRGSSWRARD